MPAGYIYVLSNPAMPNLVKVGMTTRDPADRAAELSGSTGIPSPFVLIYQQPIEDCEAGEKWVHARLDAMGFRHSSRREFFSGPLHEIVQVVFNAASVVVAELLPGDVEPVSTETDVPMLGSEVAQTLYEEACTLRKGSAFKAPDLAGAVTLWEQAWKLGHLDAALQLADALPDRKLMICEKLAERGHFVAMWHAARHHFLERRLDIGRQLAADYYSYMAPVVAASSIGELSPQLKRTIAEWVCSFRAYDLPIPISTPEFRSIADLMLAVAEEEMEIRLQQADGIEKMQLQLSMVLPIKSFTKAVLARATKTPGAVVLK